MSGVVDLGALSASKQAAEQMDSMMAMFGISDLLPVVNALQQTGDGLAVMQSALGVCGTCHALVAVDSWPGHYEYHGGEDAEADD